MSGGVLFWVQHLLGAGHLRRSAAIAKAAAARGLEVTLASGGLPLPRLDLGGAGLVQLAPVRAADEGFSRLVDAAGAPADSALRASRIAVLEALVALHAPGVVVTETFPFGRRQLAEEVLALLDAARRLPRPPVVVCSVRDILQRQEKPERWHQMLDLALARYDRVMVHGDPRLVAFADSFPLADRLGERLVHTGYVASSQAPARRPGGPGTGEVVVSAGSGAVGRVLFDAAVAARPLSRRAATRTWRLLTGEGAATWSHATDGIVVEPNRSDFPVLLANCAVSVSRGGYNTVIDLLTAGARAVIVPFAAGGETEQTERAQRLADRGMVAVVAEAALTPASLAAAVDRAFDLPPLSAHGLDLGGAARSAALLATWAHDG